MKKILTRSLQLSEETGEKKESAESTAPFPEEAGSRRVSAAKLLAGMGRLRLGSVLPIEPYRRITEAIGR